jgi:cytochrome c biogenesis protein CcmG/thiol:disulfide interchange protein DsbE
MDEIIGANPALDAAGRVAGGEARRRPEPDSIELDRKTGPGLQPAAGPGPLGLSSDLHGEVSLVNVFASWCVACREEHPLLLAAM